MARRAEDVPIWRVIRGILGPILWSISSYTVRHKERIPATGAYVLAPNHNSEFDPLCMGYINYVVGNRVPRFLAKESLFRVPVLGWILRASGQIPVARANRGSNRQSLVQASNLVEDGLAVIVYPEGTLTRDPDLWPMRGKPGAVRLALEYGIPLIPLAHWGAQTILPRYGRLPRLIPRKHVEAIVGEPFDLTPWRGRATDAAAVAEATDALMAEIARLLGELRGETPPATRWDPAEHGQSETGKF